jgi:HPt (histidine-containing phosphotransfer) domain-containing protein
MSSELLDLELFEELVQTLGVDLFGSLIGRLRARCHDDIPALIHACEAGDAAASRHLAHKLAGATAQVGAKALSQELRTVERRLSEGATEAACEIAGGIPSLFDDSLNALDAEIQARS